MTTYALADGREIRVVGRYFRSADGRVREDSGDGSVIADTRRGTLTLLNSQSKEALVMSMPDPKQVKTPPPSAPLSTYGQGDIEGYSVSKARATESDGTSRELWVATDLGLALFSRIQVGTTTTTKTLSKVRSEEPDHTVFEIPEGYSVSYRNAPTELERVPAPNPAPGRRGGR
jgi:hypothetical protein